ncbi:hypothetical protein NEPAR06_0537 [Nematocida parisii]|nr:hypothetical protein NEPAR08_0323 [Nematocida parisii]KAI5127119.1 hypothetical protein NEPAR03_0786 [Nematocida parisii]KAI5140036.1 hypothetical protein NEPAR04_0010 [Nematocida parisii]KAI5143657.1 hypothetical protein NEPAR07_0755 [Nematocida parisii]KAI5153543.1 hypothetical protein NEPAR06_0537 [Nematocida parisii]
MDLRVLYKRAKELFPFVPNPVPLVQFLTRRAAIDEIEYKSESSIKIRKARRIEPEEDEEIIKKKSKKKIQ